MHLVNIGLVHWHLFPLLDIPVEGPVIGISGENKSGKSTILDAIQTVMTGADQKVMNLNRAASDAGRGAHRRTLQAYCLGRLSASDPPLRLTSSTTIVLAFRDPSGLRPPVSIGVALEAETADNTARVASRFIVRGVELRAADIVVQSDNGMEVQPWGDRRRTLETEISSRGGSLEEYRDTAREFVREYMFVLFEKGRTALAPQFLRSFVNAIAFREMGSANDFVRSYLLEEEPIQVQALRRSIQVYRDADRQVKELNAQLAVLRGLETHLDELAALEAKAQREEWIALRARASAAIKHHSVIRRRLRRTNADIEHEEEEQRRCANEISRIRNEQQSVGAERSAALSEDRQAIHRRDIEIYDRDLEDLRRPLMGKDGLAVAIRQLAMLRPLVDIAEADASFFELVDEADPLLPAPMETAFPRNPERLDAIAAALTKLVPSVSAALERIRQRLADEEHDLAIQHRELTERITAAKEGRVVLARNVQAMVERLTADGMKPRVLAELVDIAEERWADAAEGYLGIDREAIFVAPEDCYSATDILARDRALYRHVRIANTRKLRSMERRAERGTLASVFRTRDPLAEAFLVFRTGRIQLGQSKADFDRQGRWILDDGTYDDGVVIDVKEPQGGRKLGARGVELSAARAAADLASVAAALETKRRDLKVCALWGRYLERFGDLFERSDAASPSFSDLVEKAGLLFVRIDEANNAIAAFASADVSVFDRELSLLQKGLNDSLQEHDSRAEALKSLYRKQGDDLGTLDGGEERPGSRRHAQMERWRFRQGITRLAVANPIPEYVVRRQAAKSAMALAENAAREADAAREEGRDLRTQCEIDARACLHALKQGDLFGLRPSLFDEIRPWVREQIEEIANETLVEYEAELSEARRKTNDIFRNSFANELAARFAKVDAELRDIREILKKYDFLDERYNFRSQRAPGYEAFHSIVDRLHEVELADVQLFKGDVGDDHPLATELRIVESVLLAEDVDITLYEDYRRYFTFELEITSLSSGRTVPWSERKGTASGGETQTPYYVALLSALSSIYYGGARSRTGDSSGGLCLAAFDEAFSKLDETVRYEMVSFCQELGLQLLICGPDGGRQSMERYAHTIVDVWRRGDESYARADTLTQRTRDELAAIDPSRLSREELERQMIE